MAIPTIAVELGMCNIMDRELLITDLAQLLLKWHPNRAISGAGPSLLLVISVDIPRNYLMWSFSHIAKLRHAVRCTNA